jgi:hypothetical protein
MLRCNSVRKEIQGIMKIPIFINRVKYEALRGEITGLQILELAALGADHELFLLRGEGDPSGGRPIGLDQQIELKAGEHFRAIPRNRNFGSWLSHLG